MSQILPLIRRLAQNAGDRSGDGRLEKFFIFRFGDKSYAIPAVDVTEVAMPGSLIEVPQKSDLIRGVVNIRGTVIPIINLRQRIGVAPDYQLGENSRLLLFTVRPNAFIGMIADDIEYRLREGIIEPVLPNIAEPGEKFFRTAVIDSQRVPVFMVDTWLEKPEFEILRNVVESF
ncbi:MAG TPA: chemotaxis protein CheW [Candidatus Rifleibacterium sp.]|jgi:purine-binding chemotaxis protein CheW|nr:chemotaxis protein CheW [Candidatus Rifleibacterium sp.]HNW10697.1 chemotaxis protein CheW [Candidatus Rifleibacterium sp.]HOI90420.1 chemotaxis protein CheW [Candidatus Rifleibacterium sp.]HPW57831.1 chemotaxis protein CheW [Candidatus Rifleibacterium sp.]